MSNIELTFTVKVRFYEEIQQKEDVETIGSRIGEAIVNHIEHSEVGLVGDTENFTTSIQITSDDLDSRLVFEELI